MEQRREQLLDAALQVLARDGYGRVSIDAIAREAGVTRPVVYGAFDGLGALLSALLDRQAARAIAQLTALLPAAAADPAEVVGRLYDVVAGDPLTWRPISGTEDTGRRPRADRRQPELVRARFAGLLEPALRSTAIDLEIASLRPRRDRRALRAPDPADPERLDRDRLVATVRGLIATWSR